MKLFDHWTFVAIAVFAALACTPGDEPHPEGEIIEFPISTADSRPLSIIAGRGDEMWFAEYRAPNLGRVSLDGTITEFQVEDVAEGYRDLVQDAEGAIWLSSADTPNITKRNADGTVTRFPLGELIASHLSIGRDGDIWFTTNTPILGQMNHAGTVRSHEAAVESFRSYGITLGPLGNMWCTSNAGIGHVGEATEGGEVVATTRTPTFDGRALEIATAPDGTMWFTNYLGDKITRLSPNGSMHDFVLPQEVTMPIAITVAADGNIWATTDSDHIIRMTPTGEFTLYPIPTHNSGPGGIAEGPDGNIWFTEANVGRIGVLRFE